MFRFNTKAPWAVSLLLLTSVSIASAQTSFRPLPSAAPKVRLGEAPITLIGSPANTGCDKMSTVDPTTGIRGELSAFTWDGGAGETGSYLMCGFQSGTASLIRTEKVAIGQQLFAGEPLAITDPDVVVTRTPANNHTWLVRVVYQFKKPSQAFSGVATDTWLYTEPTGGSIGTLSNLRSDVVSGVVTVNGIDKGGAADPNIDVVADPGATATDNPSITAVTYRKIAELNNKLHYDIYSRGQYLTDPVTGPRNLEFVNPNEIMVSSTPATVNRQYNGRPDISIASGADSRANTQIMFVYEFQSTGCQAYVQSKLVVAYLTLEKLINPPSAYITTKALDNANASYVAGALIDRPRITYLAFQPNAGSKGRFYITYQTYNPAAPTALANREIKVVEISDVFHDNPLYNVKTIRTRESSLNIPNGFISRPAIATYTTPLATPEPTSAGYNDNDAPGPVVVTWIEDNLIVAANVLPGAVTSASVPWLVSDLPPAAPTRPATAYYEAPSIARANLVAAGTTQVPDNNMLYFWNDRNSSEGDGIAYRFQNVDPMVYRSAGDISQPSAALHLTSQTEKDGLSGVQPVPNPANASSKVLIKLADGDVALSLTVVDATTGRTVATLLADQLSKTSFVLSEIVPASVPAGVYLIRLTTNVSSRASLFRLER